MVQLGNVDAVWFRLFGAHSVSASFSWAVFKPMWHKQCYPHPGSCWSLALSLSPILFPSPNLGWDLSAL